MVTPTWDDGLPLHLLGEGVHGHVGGGPALELHVDRLVVAHVIVAGIDAPAVGSRLQGLLQSGHVALHKTKNEQE